MIGIKEDKEKTRKKMEKDINKEKRMFEERDEMLMHYMSGVVHPMNVKSKEKHRKETGEPTVKKLWKKHRATHMMMHGGRDANVDEDGAAGDGGRLID